MRLLSIFVCLSILGTRSAFAQNHPTGVSASDNKIKSLSADARNLLEEAQRASQRTRAAIANLKPGTSSQIREWFTKIDRADQEITKQTPQDLTALAQELESFAAPVFPPNAFKDGSPTDKAAWSQQLSRQLRHEFFRLVVRRCKVIAGEDDWREKFQTLLPLDLWHYCEKEKSDSVLTISGPTKAELEYEKTEGYRNQMCKIRLDEKMEKAGRTYAESVGIDPYHCSSSELAGHIFNEVGQAYIGGGLAGESHAQARVAPRRARVARAPVTERETAIEEAHRVGRGEMGKDGKNPAAIGNYTRPQIRQKAEILDRAGFTPAERRALMESGRVGETALRSGSPKNEHEAEVYKRYRVIQALLSKAIWLQDSFVSAQPGETIGKALQERAHSIIERLWGKEGNELLGNLSELSILSDSTYGEAKAGLFKAARNLYEIADVQHKADLLAYLGRLRDVTHDEDFAPALLRDTSQPLPVLPAQQVGLGNETREPSKRMQLMKTLFQKAAQENSPVEFEFWNGNAVVQVRIPSESVNREFPTGWFQTKNLRKMRVRTGTVPSTVSFEEIYPIGTFDPARAESLRMSAERAEAGRTRPTVETLRTDKVARAREVHRLLYEAARDGHEVRLERVEDGREPQVITVTLSSERAREWLVESRGETFDYERVKGGKDYAPHGTWDEAQLKREANIDRVEGEVHFSMSALTTEQSYPWARFDYFMKHAYSKFYWSLQRLKELSPQLYDEKVREFVFLLKDEKTGVGSLKSDAGRRRELAEYLAFLRIATNDERFSLSRVWPPPYEN